MLEKYTLLFCTLFFSLISASCIAPNHATERDSPNPYLTSEQIEFSRAKRLEITRDVNRAELSQLMDKIFKEKQQDKRIQLIAPWLETNTLSRHEQPHVWSFLNLISAETYRKLYYIDRKPNHLHKAIEHYQKAQQVITRDKYPYEWAAIQNNLAKTFIDLPDRERINNIERVIELTSQASQIRTRERFPLDWANSQIIMAIAFRERISGDKTTNLKKAVDLFNQALYLQTRKGYPKDYAITIYEFTLTLMESGEYSLALSQILSVLELNEKQFKNVNSLPSEAQHLANQAEKLFANAIWLSIQLEDYSKAVSLMEWSKSRLLSKNLELDLLGKDKKNNIPSTSPHIEEIYQRLSILPLDSALVAPIFSDYGTVIFLLPANTTKIDKNNILIIPGFTRKDLHTLMRGNNTTGEWGGYVKAYMSWVFDQGNKKKLQSWQSELNNALDTIFLSWLEPVLSRLQENEFNNTARLFWIVDSDTNLLPIHSIVFRDQPLLKKYSIQFIPNLFSIFSAQKNFNNNKKDHLLAVINPTKDLVYASIEGEFISHFFESQTQLNELDASLFNFNQELTNKSTYLHIAAHGKYNWKKPSESGLLLSDDKFTLNNLFQIPKILNSNRLIFLSACETGIVDFNLPTESVGLPAAFLQAGALGVISTLWSVPDKSTMLLTAKFYQLHRTQHLEPSKALAQAQLWLQSATNEEIYRWFKNDLPNTQKSGRKLSKMFEHFLVTLKKESQKNPSDKPYQSRFYWAGFVYTGI